jgi:hypothetical protein
MIAVLNNVARKLDELDGNFCPAAAGKNPGEIIELSAGSISAAAKHG